MDKHQKLLEAFRLYLVSPDSHEVKLGDFESQVWPTLSQSEFDNPAITRAISEISLLERCR
jgi:hypothetical protein